MDLCNAQLLCFFMYDWYCNIYYVCMYVYLSVFSHTVSRKCVCVFFIVAECILYVSLQYFVVVQYEDVFLTTSFVSAYLYDIFVLHAFTTGSNKLP